MTTPSRPRPGNAALTGNRVPQPHRFFLTDGRVLRGDLYRSPGSRLADHVAGLKGYISVVNAVVVTPRGGGSSESASPTRMDFIALNSSHVLFIEELHTDA